MMLRPALRPPLRAPMRGPLTLDKGGGDIITSIFADGTDGFYFDFSKTDRLFQNLIGTPADDAGENIYLGLESHGWSGRTFAQQLAVQPELWTNPAPTVVNFGGSSGAYDTGTLTFTNSGTAVLGYPRFQFNLGLTAGRVYKVEGLLTGSRTKVNLIRLAGAGSANLVGYNSSTGVFSGIVPAATNYLELTLDPSATWTGADSVVIASISVKEVPGNHGLQATTSAQPKWQTGGLARFDGSDDNLLTTLTPASSFSMLAKVKVTSSAAYKITIGSSDGTNRCWLGVTDVGDVPACRIGSGTQVSGSASVAGSTCVLGAVSDGATVKLYVNGAEVGSQTFAGGAPAVALALGGLNTSGVLSAFMPEDAYYKLAIKKALTAAQIATITNKWGTS